MQKSNINIDNDKIDAILSSHKINAADFESSTKQRKYGKVELSFKLMNSFSYKEFVEACINISSNNEYIYYTKNDCKENCLAYLVYNSEKISLKEILAYIIELGYIPAPASDIERKKTVTNNSDTSSDVNDNELPDYEDNIGPFLKFTIDVFLYIKMGIWYIIKSIINLFTFIIKGIWGITRDVVKALIEIFIGILKAIFNIIKIIFEFLDSF